jgi:chaperonin GroES
VAPDFRAVVMARQLLFGRSSRVMCLFGVIARIELKTKSPLLLMEFRPMAAATKEKTKVKLVPLGDRIVVQREESKEKTSGGIFLPDSAKDRPTRGKVVSVGDGRVLDNGSRSTLQLKAGDHVLFTSYAGENIEIDGEEYLLMSENEVLAVIG